MKKIKKAEGTSIADDAYNNMKIGKITWLAKFTRDLVERSLEFKCSFELALVTAQQTFTKTSRRRNAKKKFSGYELTGDACPICSFDYKGFKKGYTTAFIGGDMCKPRVRPEFVELTLDGLTYKKESSFNNIVESFCRLIHEHGFEEWSVENSHKSIVVQMRKTPGKLH